MKIKEILNIIPEQTQVTILSQTRFLKTYISKFPPTPHKTNVNTNSTLFDEMPMDILNSEIMSICPTGHRELTFIIKHNNN